MTTMRNSLSFLNDNGQFAIDEDRVRSCEVPNIGLARQLGLAWKKRLKLPSAARVAKKSGGRLLALIDMQRDFDDRGRLPVKGTFGDVARVMTRAWRGFIEQPEVGYTEWIDTNDFHPAHVIHGDSWWEDTDGNFPDMESLFAAEMVLIDANEEYPYELQQGGKAVGKPFKPRMETNWTINQYSPHLKKSGQGNIWVFKSHCRMGTDGVEIIPALAEFREFIAVARDVQPTSMFKGQIAKVDWFGPFHPCMEVTDHPQGGWQKAALDRIRANAASEFAGEAEDFCVNAGTDQTLVYYKDAPEVLAKVRFLKDCTSAIFPDDPSAGRTRNADHQRKMSTAGVQLITHDSPFVTA